MGCAQARRGEEHPDLEGLGAHPELVTGLDRSEVVGEDHHEAHRIIGLPVQVEPAGANTLCCQPAR